MKRRNDFASVIKSSEQLINFLKLTIVGVYEIITVQEVEELGGPIRIAELSGTSGKKVSRVLCGL